MEKLGTMNNKVKQLKVTTTRGGKPRKIELILASLRSHPEGMTPKQIKDLQKDGRMASLITNIAADLTLQKTIEFLVTTAKGESWPKTEDQTEEETESTPEKLSDPEETVPVEVPAEETKETNTQSEDA